jgi:NSS family neurotransmitter:Na+ symporter
MKERGQWGSRIAFVLAAAGSAVGLGNLWKFPYLAWRLGMSEGHTGAGGFVFVYVLCVLLVGVPVMVAEIVIGRLGRRNPVGSFEVLRPKTGWKYVGVLGVVTGFLIMAYYCVVAGWSVEYVAKSVVWQFGGYETLVSDKEALEYMWESEGKPKSFESFASALQSRQDFQTIVREKKLEIFPERLFQEFISSPTKLVFYLFVFLALTALVVLGGIKNGIERWNKILMPALLLIMLVLVVRALTLPKGAQALLALFRPDFSSVGFDTVLWALGQAFFSLSLGMGAMLTYGSYMRREDKVTSSAVMVSVVDTLVALCAAFVIFSSILSYNIQIKGAGISNLFTAMPAIFIHLPMGQALCILFYCLVLFAALTSTVSLLEVVASYFIDQKGMDRKKSVLLSSVGMFILGIPCALSFNLLKDFTITGKTFFDLLDFLCANIALPLGGILICIFAGFVLKREEVRHELFELSSGAVSIWRLLVRFLAPAAIFCVFLGLLMGWISS